MDLSVASVDFAGHRAFFVGQEVDLHELFRGDVQLLGQALLDHALCGYAEPSPFDLSLKEPRQHGVLLRGVPIGP